MSPEEDLGLVEEPGRLFEVEVVRMPSFEPSKPLRILPLPGHDLDAILVATQSSAVLRREGALAGEQSPAEFFRPVTVHSHDMHVVHPVTGRIWSLKEWPAGRWGTARASP